VLDLGEIVLSGVGKPADAPAFLNHSREAPDASEGSSSTVPGFLESEPGDKPAPASATGSVPADRSGDALDKIRDQIALTNQSEADRLRQDAMRRKAEEERQAALRRKAEQERLAALRQKQEEERLAALRQKDEQDRAAAERRRRRAQGAQALLEGFLTGFANGVGGGNKQPDQPGTLPDGTPEQPLKDIVVSSRRVTIAVWDTQCEDGDRISVRINGMTVVNNVTLTKARKSFDVTLSGPINSMELISESTGTDCPPGRVPLDQTVNSGAMAVSNAIEGGTQNWQLANRTRGSSAQIVVR
jgi:hypothetical protein